VLYSFTRSEAFLSSFRSQFLVLSCSCFCLFRSLCKVQFYLVLLLVSPSAAKISFLLLSLFLVRPDFIFLASAGVLPSVLWICSCFFLLGNFHPPSQGFLAPSPAMEFGSSLAAPVPRAYFGPHETKFDLAIAVACSSWFSCCQDFSCSSVRPSPRALLRFPAA
jgi:hypothetical protein